VTQGDIAPIREPTDRSYTIYVCPECRRQSHPHDGACSKDVRPGQFRPAHMYEVVPVEVVPLSEVERLEAALRRIYKMPCAYPDDELEDVRLLAQFHEAQEIAGEALRA
jgi:hypothetical protein